MDLDIDEILAEIDSSMLSQITSVDSCLNFIENFIKENEMIKKDKIVLTSIVFLMKSIFFKIDDFERKLDLLLNKLSFSR